MPDEKLVPNNKRLARPLVPTHREVGMLLVAAGARLARLMSAHASGAFTGEEIGKRIDAWKALIGKLSEAVEERP